MPSVPAAVPSRLNQRKSVPAGGRRPDQHHTAVGRRSEGGLGTNCVTQDMFLYGNWLTRELVAIECLTQERSLTNEEQSAGNIGHLGFDVGEPVSLRRIQ